MTVPSHSTLEEYQAFVYKMQSTTNAESKLTKTVAPIICDKQARNPISLR